LCLKGRPGKPGSKESAEAVVAAGLAGSEGPNVREGEARSSLEGAMPQMTRQLELPFMKRGEAPSSGRSVEAPTAARGSGHPGNDGAGVMERVLSRPNLKAALKRVRKNKGSPGVDGMTTEGLLAYLWEHWGRIREELLAGRYQPSPVLRQQIPKSGGGVRELGIPTVLDRFIQQALLQVLQPGFDATFSRHSYGFRPKRSAQDAVMAAKRLVQDGRRFVVDVDLEKFFDRVNHDVLMGRLAKRIRDGRVLGLIRRYLDAGVMVNGVVMERGRGTPQGGPLSPLLANVLLDEVDRELERRGHEFVRYADDCNVYVRSRRAGERVMGLLRQLYADLRLRVNESKSAVDLVWKRKILGYSFWVGAGRTVKLRVAGQALDAMKDRVRRITRRTTGRSMDHVVGELREYLPGWRNYFGLAETPGTFADVDKWIRHRLRAIYLKQWKRGTTVYREMRARGASEHVAATAAVNTRRWWKNASMALHTVLPTSHFDALGLPRLSA
jgi:RNA-directed DNA polymerase